MLNPIRHPEAAAHFARPSKGDGPGRSSFEARKSSHLKMTAKLLSLGIPAVKLA
jgi:hypothetical protein